MTSKEFRTSMIYKIFQQIMSDNPNLDDVDQDLIQDALLIFLTSTVVLQKKMATKNESIRLLKSFDPFELARYVIELGQADHDLKFNRSSQSGPDSQN